MIPGLLMKSSCDEGSGRRLSWLQYSWICREVPGRYNVIDRADAGQYRRGRGCAGVMLGRCEVVLG